MAEIIMEIYILQGIWVTLQYTLVAFLGGSIIGTTLAFLKYNHKAVWLINAYISFMRGTPLLVQLTLVYFVLPSLLGVSISVFVAGAIAFSVNSSAYIAEIIRAGLNNVDRGQFEASQALGISKFHMWKDIIFPQALRTIMPALINEAITLVKETALISTLGEQDIMRRAQLVSAEQYTYLQPLLTAAASYYLLTFLLEQMSKFYDYHRKPL